LTLRADTIPGHLVGAIWKVFLVAAILDVRLLGQHAAHFCALAAANSTLKSGHAYDERACSANTLRISARWPLPARH
jgi:hypothetical protein